jgi:hypothetical protein
MKKTLKILTIIAMMMLAEQTFAQDVVGSNRPVIIKEVLNKEIILKNLPKNVNKENLNYLFIIGEAYEYNGKIFFKIMDFVNGNLYFCSSNKELNKIKSLKIKDSDPRSFEELASNFLN